MGFEEGSLSGPFAAVAIPLLLGACGDGVREASASQGLATLAEREQEAPRLPEDIFEHLETITLEEDTAVINVSPRVEVAPDGSLLIADGREVRVRIYDGAGRLVNQFGRRGAGPGEMRMPTSARRMPGGTVLVSDFTGLLLEFDSVGETFLTGLRVPVVPLYGTRPVDGGQRLLLAGQRTGTGGASPLLHIWDRDSESIVRSFFPTPGDESVRLASRNFGGSAISVRGDTVAAVSAFTDTLFFFTADGEEAGRVPVPFTAFRRMETYNPRLPPEVLQKEWLTRLDLLTDVFWLDDGSLLIQYERPRGVDSEWALLRTNRAGDRIFETTNTPRLLAVSGERLYFIHPESITPNRWLVARLR